MFLRLNTQLAKIFRMIPVKRWMLYILALSFVPAVCVVLHIWMQYSELKLLRDQADNVQRQAITLQTKLAPNRSIQKLYQNADHYYIDKHLESLVLLQSEIDSLKQLCASHKFVTGSSLRKRLEFLTGSENKLSFTEGQIQTAENFQETSETLSRPVEVDLDDLQTILGRVEGVQWNMRPLPEGRQHLIITEFKLERKEILENIERFVLNMKLIKREYLEEEKG